MTLGLSAFQVCDCTVMSYVAHTAEEGFWWAIVTQTTVGYGDISPVTVGGKIIGAIAASLGVVLLAIPAGIFISGACMTSSLHTNHKSQSSCDCIRTE